MSETTPLPADVSALIRPDDEHNRELVRNTHPQDWENPTPKARYNLVVIGAGTAGLTAAGGCAATGGRVAIIERKFTGGDCLVSGCVPSKGLIRAAKAAAAVRRAGQYGVRVPDGVEVDFASTMERMRRLRALISPVDSVHHLKASGVDVFLGEAAFTGPDTVQVDGKTLRFVRAVIATGSRAAVPPIPGLEEAGYLTNETIFQLTELPRRLAMIGAGPIGCEMAQTFQRLGSRVILINNAPHILPREDADAAALVQQAFAREDVRLIQGAATKGVQRRGADKVLTVESEGKTDEIVCDEVLVSAGRRPNLEGLNLEAAGVEYTRHGVTVDDNLRTSNPRIYSAGDISATFKFTHTASALGRIAMVNALFWGRQKMSGLIVPWCTYTEPEIAHVGLYEPQAVERGLAVDTITVPFRENDRAILQGDDEGFVRVHLRKGTDKILGATIVSEHAGDMVTYFTLAMNNGQGLSALANAIYPYPTEAEILKKLANLYLQRKLSPKVRQVLGAIQALRRR